jgi:hypothetical protein
MRRRLIAATLAAAASLLVASPALGATYLVTDTADTVGTPCTPQGTAGVFNCTSLRQAVSEANASSDATDEVFVNPATYSLSLGELSLATGVSLIGPGARTTRIVNFGATTASRVVHVPVAATEVLIAGVSIEDGFVSGQRGANILNEGQLDLFQVVITGGHGSENTGGGISNFGGDLTIVESLIEGNQADFSGGGIDNEARGGTPASLRVDDSTIANNQGSTGSGIQTGQAGNTVDLNHVTFAHNVPGTGLTIAAGGQTVTTYGSIFYTSTSGNPNCGTIKPTDLGYNLDSASSCAFSGNGSVSAQNPLLSGGLVNAGGPTDLFTIASGSPAENLVAQCATGLDQRGYLRNQNPLEPCDAGAYEISGTQIVEQPPIPTPTPPPPVVQTPVPTPTATPVATPVANQSVGAKPVSGKVLVKVPGSKEFVELDESVIKNGAEVDTRKGVVEITRSDGGKAKFSDGIFKISQPGGITTMTLTEALDCKKKGKAGAAAKKPKTRKLWGDGKGKFRTKGQYGAATIRGTRWLTQDTCTTTVIKVTEGSVSVRDLVKRKTVVLRKGKTYIARARK